MAGKGDSPEFLGRKWPNHEVSVKEDTFTGLAVIDFLCF